jgi:hypothetical protein
MLLSYLKHATLPFVVSVTANDHRMAGSYLVIKTLKVDG